MYVCSIYAKSFDNIFLHHKYFTSNVCIHDSFQSKCIDVCISVCTHISQSVHDPKDEKRREFSMAQTIWKDILW